MRSLSESLDRRIPEKRGREIEVDPHGTYSTGRGGLGNIRSPSRENIPHGTGIVAPLPPHEEEHKYPTSFGRGGLGNMDRSKSREPTSKSPHRGAAFSSGRGGLGNMHSGEAPLEVEHLEYHDGGIHSTGRGGAANFSTSPSPPIENQTHHHADHATSTGRGGAGNMVYEDGEAGHHKQHADHAHPHGIAGKLLDKLTHPSGHHENEGVNGKVEDS